MKRRFPVQTPTGGAVMESKNVAINGVVYEVQRIYSGERSASDIVRQRLLEAKRNNPPLTKPQISSYNINGAGMSGEVR